jgi:hypothetical protein
MSRERSVILKQQRGARNLDRREPAMITTATVELGRYHSRMQLGTVVFASQSQGCELTGTKSAR